MCHHWERPYNLSRYLIVHLLIIPNDNRYLKAIVTTFIWIALEDSSIVRYIRCLYICCHCQHSILGSVVLQHSPTAKIQWFVIIYCLLVSFSPYRQCTTFDFQLQTRISLIALLFCWGPNINILQTVSEARVCYLTS